MTQPKQSKLEKLLDQQGLTEDEAVMALKQLQKPHEKRQTYSHRWNPKRVKLGFIPDSHIGSTFFDKNIFDDAVKSFNREKVDAVYHVGDIIEGMSNRDGHIYELDIPGVTNQIDYACELLSNIKQPLYFIEGNHHQWASRKANQGVEVGRIIENQLPNSKRLGEMVADIKLAKNIRLRLSHEGSSAYALSYSGQKRINALEGGTKPNIIINGHLHKSMYMQYRNIHYFEAGSMQRQTPFMAMKGSPAMLGYWILDIGIQNGNIRELTQKWYPHY